MSLSPGILSPSTIPLASQAYSPNAAPVPAITSLQFSQEIQFLQSVYHFMLWKESQEQLKERANQVAPINDSMRDTKHDGKTDDGDVEEKTSLSKDDSSKKLPAKNLATGKCTTDSEKHLATLADTAEKLATLNSRRYGAVTDVLMKVFPEHLCHFKPSVLTSQMPPIISSYFFEMPALQWQLHCARTELSNFQNRETQYKEEITSLKRKLTQSTEASVSKRAKTDVTANDVDNKNGTDNESLAAIVDIFRENAMTLKEKLKQEKRRTDQASKQAKKLAEKAQKSANEAREALAFISKAEKSEDKKPPGVNQLKYPLDTEYKIGAVSFDERIKELEHFKSKIGHCRVPHRLPGLGRWVGKQRELYKAYKDGKRPKNLTEDRIKILDDMGFKWNCKDKSEASPERREKVKQQDPKQPPTNTDDSKAPTSLDRYKAHATFEERIKELEHYRLKEGHCRVPLRLPGLGRWVGEMRSAYRLVQKGNASNVLNEEKIKILNDMGFEWTVSKPAVPWAQRYEELLAFKKATGHTNVPRGYEANPPLADWVNEQRKLYRQHAGVLKGDRVQKLKEIGFDWNPGSSAKKEKAIVATNLLLKEIDERYGEC